MSIQKTYRKGEKYQHTAQRENAISEVINRIQQTGSSGVYAKTGGVVKIPCWNASKNRIKAGTAVIFPSEYQICGDAFPVIPYVSGYPSFGILQTTLEENEIGSVIVAGAVRISNYAGLGDYVKPSEGGMYYKLGENGIPVLYSGRSGLFVLLGGPANYANESQGPFALLYYKYINEETEEVTDAIHVSPGYISCNGTMRYFSGTDLYMSEIEEAEAQTDGYICIETFLNDNATWSEIKIVFTSSVDEKHYPIGVCNTPHDWSNVYSFRPCVPAFIIAGDCNE